MYTSTTKDNLLEMNKQHWVIKKNHIDIGMIKAKGKLLRLLTMKLKDKKIQFPTS